MTTHRIRTQRTNLQRFLLGVCVCVWENINIATHQNSKKVFSSEILFSNGREIKMLNGTPQDNSQTHEMFRWWCFLFISIFNAIHSCLPFTPRYSSINEFVTSARVLITYELDMYILHSHVLRSYLSGPKSQNKNIIMQFSSFVVDMLWWSGIAQRKGANIFCCCCIWTVKKKMLSDSNWHTARY